MSKAAELAALIGSGQAQGNKNLIINGAMNVAQRSTSVTGNTAGGYLTCDRINFVHNMGTWTVTQSSDAPSSEGFLNAYRIDCTTADTSVAATDYLLVQQKIEGQNLQTLRKGTSSAKSVTLSFFVKSNTTGNFVIELYDNDNARQISALYTISSANTWEKKTVTFAGDTSGAFGDDNAESLQINWWLGAGSNYTSGTLNTSWASATTANRVVGTQNLAASTDNDWAITGVQLEIGDVATAFEHEDIGTTLAKCQRYYQQEVVTWILGVEGTRNSKLPFPHKVSMRTAPTATLTGGSAANGTLLGTVDVTSETTNFHFWLGSSGSLTNATFSAYTFKATAEL